MGKYLIVEDNIDKFDSVRNELLKLNISENDIDHVDSVNAATNLIKVNVYTMVILDLNLPMIKNSPPVENGGVTLLNKLKNNPKKYNLPSQIIGLTSYEYLKKLHNSDFENLCFSIYDYELGDWKSVLSNKIAWDASSNTSRVKPEGRKIVLTVHGIRTLGEWQKKLKHSIEENYDDIEVETYRYNYFSAFQLLIPRYRKKVITKLSLEIERLSQKYPNSRFTIFSHSFGTYATVRALEALPISCDLNIDNLVLVSSVMKSEYSFDRLIDKHSINCVYNECGYNDNVLLLSHYACIDMGMAGRSGFVGTSVINRFYQGGHDFFNRSDTFIDSFWLPIISGEAEKDVDERQFSFIRENIEIVLYTRHITLFVLFFIPIFLYALGQ
ncbi:hypothetical protein [Vibrio owensii]|uniref:hypothetical protein n=1 Tax=Vibrio owensii TaxID=696485 RepID=UPI002220FCEF|nr:hypothetical protein [Vibrio owensii]